MYKKSERSNIWVMYGQHADFLVNIILDLQNSVASQIPRDYELALIQHPTGIKRALLPIAQI